MKIMVNGKISEIFQFTPLRKGRPPDEGELPSGLSDFNSRPCVRGDGIALAAALGRKFQFTPLRKGRLGVGGCPAVSDSISIHAPA